MKLATARIRTVMNRQSIHFVLILQLLGCLHLMSISALSLASTLDADEIKQLLSSPSSLAFKKSAEEDLQRLYAARDYQPIWFTAEPDSPRIELALGFIADAEAEGLDSRDYQLQHLRQLQQPSQQSVSAAAELELRTTHALMTLAGDLAHGRFVAAAADPDWHIQQPAFDAVSFLDEAIKNNRLEQAFSTLPPQSAGYQRLKQTLSRYRNLSDKQADWVRIPDTPLIRPNSTHTVIPLIRQRMAQVHAVEDIAAYKLPRSNSQQYDTPLVNAIKAFQIQHGLNPDGVIGEHTLNALNTPLAWKIRQLRINMERLRWLPRNLGTRYLLVNTAGFRLTAMQENEPVLSMRIIVGRDYRSTPSFNSALTHLIMNPYWNVPASIARKDLLPKQQRDPGFFSSSNIKVYPAQRHDAKPLDPATINWNAIKQGFPYVLRQDPGDHNALGKIKFMLPNPFNIYLHDTPSKSLFQKDVRTFSSGCIRLEKPLDLAAFTLGETSLPTEFITQLDSGKTITKHLPRQLPVYLVYITAWTDEQETVHFSTDIYGRDSRALRYAGW